MNIITLAQKINRKGDLYIKNNGTKNFHKEALAMLLDSDFPSSFNIQDVAQSVFKRSPLHKQNFSKLEFSDLPITLSRGEHCFIDLYFWRRRPTVVHDHHFSGSFMCLLGNNVDLEYTFEETKSLGRYHALGKLKLHDERILKPGDAVSIAPLDKFIHQNHHQADLTVNLCFRTPDLTKKNLSNYLYSGLKYEKSSQLLGKIQRLRKFLNIENIDVRKLDLNADEMICFLIHYAEVETQNQRLNNTIKYFDSKVRKEFKISIPDMLKKHDLELSKLEDQYE